MEAIFLVFVGGALLSHSWYLLELYPDGRTMGLYTAGLALASLIALTFAPMVLTGLGPGGEVLADADAFAETNVMKALIILWAGYGVGIGAHGLWDFDERAIGFYTGFLAIATLVSMIYYAANLEGVYGDGVWLGLSGSDPGTHLPGGRTVLLSSHPVQRAPTGGRVVPAGRIYSRYRHRSVHTDHRHQGYDLELAD